MNPGNFASTQKSGEKRNKSFRFHGNKIHFSEIAFLAWRKYIYELTGIRYLENKKEILSRRLLQRMVVLGFNSFEKYLNYVRNQSNGEEILLMEAVCNGETSFFRHKRQLDTMVSALLRELKPENQIDEEKTLRIWSAGCSTGEEAYTIAIMIQEHILNKFPPVKVEILGTDINMAGLDFAAAGSYDKLSIANIPKPFLEKYFSIKNNRYYVIPGIKELVKFKYYNFNDLTVPHLENKYDLIYCANVLMYFDEQSRARAMSKIFNSLVDQGSLFIGYSEILPGLIKVFSPENKYGSIFYKKNV